MIWAEVVATILDILLWGWWGHDEAKGQKFSLVKFTLWLLVVIVVMFSIMGYLAEHP